MAVFLDIYPNLWFCHQLFPILWVLQGLAWGTGDVYSRERAKGESLRSLSVATQARVLIQRAQGHTAGSEDEDSPFPHHHQASNPPKMKSVLWKLTHTNHFSTQGQ